MPVILRLVPAYHAFLIVQVMRHHQNRFVAMRFAKGTNQKLALKTVFNHPAPYFVLLIQKKPALMALLPPAPITNPIHVNALPAYQTALAMKEENALEKEKFMILQETSSVVLA